MRMMADANSPGSHGEAAGLDARLAEGDGVGRTKFSGKRFEVCCVGAAGEGGGMEQSCSGGAGRAKEKFAAFHGSSSETSFQRMVHPLWTDGWERRLSRIWAVLFKRRSV